MLSFLINVTPLNGSQLQQTVVYFKHWLYNCFSYFSQPWKIFKNLFLELIKLLIRLNKRSQLNVIKNTYTSGLGFCCVVLWCHLPSCKASRKTHQVRPLQSVSQQHRPLTFWRHKGLPQVPVTGCAFLRFSHCRGSVVAFRSVGTCPEWGISPCSAIKSSYMEAELKNKLGGGGVVLLPPIILTSAGVTGGWCKYLLIASPVTDVSNKPEIALRKFSH